MERKDLSGRQVRMSLITRTARGKAVAAPLVDTVLPDGRTVRPGVEVSIRGWTGRYIYTGWVHGDGSLSLWGGVTGHEAYRAARPAAVRTIHRIHKTRSAAAA